MVRRLLVLASTVSSILAFSSATYAQQAGGTADEAKAMLLKAIAAVKADRANALEMFKKGENGFLDRDLYVFCNTLEDGMIVALGNPNAQQLIGKDVRTLKDSAGKAFGQEIFAGEHVAEGQLTEVEYMFPRPGSDKTPVPKVSLVTKSGELGCGVGYYK